MDLPGKTNVLRLLESADVPFETAAYDPGPEHLEAEAVAREIGVDPDVLFKTLVARDDRNNLLVFCLPSTADLDLKKAARAAGAKKVALIALKELTPLTGYVRGGCSPIGMKKRYPTFVDEIAGACERIYVNAGARGLQVRLAPEDLLRVVDGKLADLS